MNLADKFILQYFNDIKKLCKEHETVSDKGKIICDHKRCPLHIEARKRNRFCKDFIVHNPEEAMQTVNGYFKDRGS